MHVNYALHLDAVTVGFAPFSESCILFEFCGIRITLEISDEKMQGNQAAFAAYLESLLGNDIISPDENGSFDKFLELKQKINEIYKIFHHGKALDTQWKNKERFFSGEKIQMFFSELDLPYEIESTSSKGSRITKVTRKQL